MSTLRSAPNIALLGLKPHSELPRYVKAFDVGLVPYRLTDYTANVYPTKLNEYLVMGIPVVATDLPEIRRFNAEHGDIVAMAGDADAFAAAIRRSHRAFERRHDCQRRIEVAHANSWQSRIAAMKVLIDEALERRAGGQAGWEETLRRVYRRTRSRAVQRDARPLRPCTCWCSTRISCGGPPRR